VLTNIYISRLVFVSAFVCVLTSATLIMLRKHLLGFTMPLCTHTLRSYIYCGAMFSKAQQREMLLGLDKPLNVLLELEAACTSRQGWRDIRAGMQTYICYL